MYDQRAKIMEARIIVPLVFIAFVSCNQTNNSSAVQTPGTKSDSTVLLPNGWKISSAGRTLPLGDLPLNIVLSRDDHYLISTNNGFSHPSLTVVSLDSEKVVQTFIIPDAWLGMAWSHDGSALYVSGGYRNRIYELNFSDGKLSFQDSIILGDAWPEKIAVAGIAISKDGKSLYAVSRENNSFYVLDLASKKITQQISLPGEAYDCLTSHDGKTVFISVWGKGEVLAFNAATNKISDSISAGNHPNAMAISKDDRTLFVSNANDNTVSVIDLAKRKTISVLNVAVHPTDLAGSTPNAICRSADEKFLFVANADNNCLAVMDVRDPLHPKSAGFIPTGWYPTAIAAGGKKIYVVNGKGNSSFANPKGPVPGQPDTIPNVQYIGGMLKGTLSVIDYPSSDQLKQYTKEVFQNTRFGNADSLREEAWTTENPIPRKADGGSPIKHVFYIIKENRTYDQVLGDVKDGNGDSSLCLFPQKITPNEHAIAHHFVLLDNFYVDAEVSADGHNWSTAAYATDYVEKTWPALYGGRGGEYNYEGAREIVKPAKGYIWDYCSRGNVSYRSYGEFADRGKASIPSLKN
ncbi:MAG: beta-propeller fold lactonase family protein, partial [Chitinophagales bacterium]